MLVRVAAAEDETLDPVPARERWGGQEQVANGEVFRPADLPGFVAEIDGWIVG